MANDDANPEPPTVGQVDPLVGTVLNGKFRLVSLIGRGGMGKIYKAEQLSLGRMVAIKLLSIVDKTSNIEEFRERFYREASLCARLSHPNIVTVHDYGSVEGAAEETLWIAMEYLQGKTLMQRVKSNRQLSPPEATAVVLEIARGIREAHKHGVVHRDLKCSNVMLVPDEEGGTRVKILDFGLVKSMTVDEGEDELTIAGGGFLGSPGYMSPEQIQRGMPIDHRTDIYSLGVILFRCLAGRNPYEGDQAQVLLAHVNAPIPTLREVNPSIDVPAALEGLVRRMLEKDAERRVSSAEEVVRALRDISEASGWAKPTTGVYDNTSSFSKAQVLVLDPTPTTGGTIKPVAVSRTTPPKKRRTRVAVLGLAGGALAASLILVLVLRHPPTERESPQPSVAQLPSVPAPVAAQPPVIAPAPAVPVPAVAPPENAAPPAAKAEPQPAAPLEAQPAHTVAPHSPVRRPAQRSRPTVTAPVAAPAPAPAARPVAPAAAPVETGFLSLDTTPWANVSEGGRAIGQTPLIRVKLSEGPHTLTLTTEHGVSKTFIVTIKAGQTVSKRLGLE